MRQSRPWASLVQARKANNLVNRWLTPLLKATSLKSDRSMRLTTNYWEKRANCKYRNSNLQAPSSVWCSANSTRPPIFKTIRHSLNLHKTKAIRTQRLAEYWVPWQCKRTMEWPVPRTLMSEANQLKAGIRIYLWAKVFRNMVPLLVARHPSGQSWDPNRQHCIPRMFTSRHWHGPMQAQHFLTKTAKSRILLWGKHQDPPSLQQRQRRSRWRQVQMDWRLMLRARLMAN